MTVAPELSRMVALDRIGSARPLEIEVEATPAECGAIAARLRIPAVTALTCHFALRREPGRIVADGELAACVVQDCVLTLEPFEAAVAERFTLHFVPAGSQTDDDDPLVPDQIVHGGSAIDVGEAAVEQLALALDPYPRRPGAAVALPADDDETPAPAPPFAALARLRRS